MIEMLSIILSIGAIYAFIPIIVILILIGAAAGLMRGSDIFALFGIGAMLGIASGAGKNAGKGMTAGNAYRSTPSSLIPSNIFGSLGTHYRNYRNTQLQTKADIAQNRLKNLMGAGAANSNVPLKTPTSSGSGSANSNVPLKTPNASGGDQSTSKGKNGPQSVRLAVFQTPVIGRYREFKYNRALKIRSGKSGLHYTPGVGNRPVIKANKTIIKTYKKNIKAQARLDKRNWEQFGNSKKEARNIINQRVKAERKSFREESERARREAYKKAKEEGADRSKTIFERASSYNKLSKNSRVPFIGEIYAIGALTKGSIKGSKEYYNNLKMARENDYSNEEYLNDALRRFSEAKLEEQNNKMFIKAMKPEEFFGLDKEGNPQLKVESIHERMKKLHESEAKLAEKAKDEATKIEHQRMADYYKKVEERTANISNSFNQRISDYIILGNSKSNIKPDELEKIKEQTYNNYIYRQSMNEENPEGVKPLSKNSYFLSQWDAYRSSALREMKKPKHPN
ncbi:MAG: hypothetical protein ACP5TL_00200 [Candidatus Micrarchaeia archaeon]